MALDSAERSCAPKTSWPRHEGVVIADAEELGLYRFDPIASTVGQRHIRVAQLLGARHLVEQLRHVDVMIDEHGGDTDRAPSSSNRLLAGGRNTSWDALLVGVLAHEDRIARGSGRARVAVQVAHEVGVDETGADEHEHVLAECGAHTSLLPGDGLLHTLVVRLGEHEPPRSAVAAGIAVQVHDLNRVRRDLAMLTDIRHGFAGVEWVIAHCLLGQIVVVGGHQLEGGTERVDQPRELAADRAGEEVSGGATHAVERLGNPCVEDTAVGEGVDDRRRAEVAIAAHSLGHPARPPGLVGVMQQSSLGTGSDEQPLDERGPTRQAGLDRRAGAEQERQPLRGCCVGDQPVKRGLGESGEAHNSIILVGPARYTYAYPASTSGRSSRSRLPPSPKRSAGRPADGCPLSCPQGSDTPVSAGQIAPIVWSPKPQRQVRFLGPPLQESPQIRDCSGRGRGVVGWRRLGFRDRVRRER